MHQDEKYFPDAQKFDPTRLLDPKETRRIEKAFVPFSKGSRACAGIKYVFCFLFNCAPAESFSLAYCELYVTLGTMFRHFEKMKSNYLTAEDLTYNDYFSAQTPLDATKFHVTEQRD